MSEAETPAEGELRKWRTGLAGWLAILLLSIAVLIAAATFIWWGALREALMDPGVPFETYSPPSAPEYGQPQAWALLPTSQAPDAADIFFVHPTTYEGRTWNAAISQPAASKLLRDVMLPNYAGPFQRVGRVFAPRYRQASLYTTLTLREDAREARAFAYQDVQAAFQHYLAVYDKGLPLVIVGAGQGGVLAERLAREAAADPLLKARLAAVYLLDTSVAAADYGPGALLPACITRLQTGCLAAYMAEAEGDKRRTRERLRHAPVWNGAQLVSLAERQPLCFNPLLGAVTDAAAPPEVNLGAANASGLEWGDRPGFLQHQVGAQCTDGVLKLTKPRSPALRSRLSWIEQQREPPYNLFYADLEADAQARLAALAKQ